VPVRNFTASVNADVPFLDVIVDSGEQWPVPATIDGAVQNFRSPAVNKADSMKVATSFLQATV
jgi:hypothetical protein